MKQKIKNIMIASIVMVVLALTVLVAANSAKTVDAEDYAYYTNFEGMVVNGSSTVDQNTGFIWANYWQNTKTVRHKNSNMLEMAIYDNATYSTAGGFGISDKSNLARCTIGEAYEVTTYFEMVNMEFVFVEFVGGDGKWGCVKVYPDGRLMEEPGGSNMSDISYVDNILKFTFTMSFNQNEGVNGYVKFTAFNTTNGKIYFDNVSIAYKEKVMDENYERMPLGVFDTTKASIFNNYFAESGVKSSFVKENNNVKAKMTFTLTQNQEGKAVFFLNKLGFINKARDYDFSFDLETGNLSNLWIYYGGTWATPNSYMKIDLTTNEVTVYGDKISSASYSNGKLCFKLNTNVTFSDWYQLQFIAQAKTANSESFVTLDNVKITQVPIVNSIELGTAGVKTRYYYGDSLDLTGLVVKANYTNGRSETVNVADCEVTGFNGNEPGNHIVTVTYQGVSQTFEVSVSRKLKSLKVNQSELKSTYNYGEEIDLSNLVVVAEYLDDGEDETLRHGAAKHGYAIDLGGYDKYTPGTYTITIYYLDGAVTFNVKVNAKNSVTFDDYSFVGTGK